MENNTQSKDSTTTIIDNLSFCVIDLETTGGNHNYDKIIEIGLVKIENLKIKDNLSYLVKPEISVPDFIQKLTSISEDDLVDAPTIDEIINEILDFIGDSILVAHNSSFDVPFINSVLKRLNRPILKNKSLCTNMMTKYLIPEIMNSNLNYMSRIFEIDHDKAHRALEDAKATANLLLIYLNIFKEKNIKKINHLYYPRNKYELDRLHVKKEEFNNKLINKLKTIEIPILIILKGDKGIFEYALPIKNPKLELENLEDLFHSLNWKIMTIKMLGSFVEALLKFNAIFNKVNANNHNHILEYLYSRYMDHDSIPKQDDHSKVFYRNFHDDIPDFVITHHLIPEQFVLFPLLYYNPKSELVFRFPSHQKKVIQYVMSQIKKSESKKKNRPFLHWALVPLINNYLKAENIKSGPCLFFSSKKVKDTSDNFQKNLVNFCSNQDFKIGYPLSHI